MEDATYFGRTFAISGSITSFLAAIHAVAGPIPILDISEQATIIGRTSSEAAAAFQLVVPTIDPAYAGNYSAVDLGIVPSRIPANSGALTFKDNNTLLLDVNTYQASAEIEAITVVRDGTGHITGFSGTGTKFANAPYIDGGLQYGPGGILYYTAFGPNQLVQFKPGSIDPDKFTDLSPLGVASSVGSLAFVPRGFGGVGYLKLISWDAKIWYSTYISPDLTGTYTVAPPSSPSTPLPNLNWEGMAFIAAGQPSFSANSVLINADLADAIYAFELDGQGNPKPATQKHFMDVGDPVGMTVDPATGDLLITTEQGPTGRHITLIKGFNPPAQPPIVTLATSKPTYVPGESIVINFTSANGIAQEWIGLFAAGTENKSYLQWSFTDGTQIGTAGPTSGTVTFQNGINSPGSYEARLFFSGAYAIEQNVSFTVAPGPPGIANNPSPAANATGISLGSTLTWTAGAGATSHTVYFGTNSILGPSDLKLSQAGTSYSPVALTEFTTYYWRIDEVNGQGTTQGVVWSFTTGSAANLPSVVTSKPTYNAGESIGVNFSNASGQVHDWIGLFAAGAADKAYLSWSFTDGTHVGTSGLSSGTVNFPAGLPAAGNYEARLYLNGTYQRQATVGFTVTSGSPASLTANPAFNRASPIIIDFSNASGNSPDWIGLFSVGAPNTAYLDWSFTDGTQVGTAGITNGLITFPSGLPTAGNYEARLFFNGNYVSAATTSFNVQ